MSAYRIGLGLDLALEDLDLIVPQPRSEGVRVARRSYAASGVIAEEGQYIEFVWDVVEDEGMYQDILQQFGLEIALTADVTIRAPHFQFAYNTFSGQAVRPEVGRDIRRRQFYLRDMVILVRNLRYSNG